MPILKVKKYAHPYVQIDKRMIEDARLSWKAKGILIYLLSKPDEWQVRVKDLVKKATDGRDAVLTGLTELIECGYATREQSHTEGGQWAETIYTISEEPQTGFPVTAKPVTDNPSHSDLDSSDLDSSNKKPPVLSPISNSPKPEAPPKPVGATNEEAKVILASIKKTPVEKAPRSVLDGREPNWADPVQAGGSDELAEILVEGICQFNVPGCGLDSLPAKQRQGWLRKASEIIQEWGGGTAEQVALAWRSWTIQYDWRSTVNPFAKTFASEFGQYLVGARAGYITRGDIDRKERDLMKQMDGDAVPADRTPAPPGGIRVNVGSYSQPEWKDLGDV